MRQHGFGRLPPVSTLTLGVKNRREFAECTVALRALSRNAGEGLYHPCVMTPFSRSAAISASL